MLSHLGPLAAALCLVGGCWLGEPAISATDPCVAGGDPGKSYSATLDEDYAVGISDVRFESGFALGLSTCGDLDSLRRGSVIPFAIGPGKSQTSDCVVHGADASLPAIVQVLGDAGVLSGNYDTSLALLHKNVTIGGCSGTLQINFDTSNRRPLDPKDPAQAPPFLVQRQFVTHDAASCPPFPNAVGNAACGDTWVATLTAR